VGHDLWIYHFNYLLCASHQGTRDINGSGGGERTGGGASAQYRHLDCVPLGRAWTKTGTVEEKRGTGYSRSPLKRHAQWLLELVAEEPVLTFEESRARLSRDCVAGRR